MNTIDALALTNIALNLIERGGKIATLIRTVQAEGRDPTEAELDVVFGDDAVARAQLQAAIDARKADPAES